MKKQLNAGTTKTLSKLSRLAAIVLLVITLWAYPVSATTYVSAEPIPSGDVVGQDALATILSAGYPSLEHWYIASSNRSPLVQAGLVCLSPNGRKKPGNAVNPRFLVDGIHRAYRSI